MISLQLRISLDYFIYLFHFRQASSIIGHKKFNPARYPCSVLGDVLWDDLMSCGADVFFGKGEVGTRERNWFAVQSWNIGLRTGKEKDYELSWNFFMLASEFYGAVVDGEMDGNNVMVCKSLILAVAAKIADEQERNASLLETEVGQAIELLDRTQKGVNVRSFSNVVFLVPASGCQCCGKCSSCNSRVSS